MPSSGPHAPRSPLRNAANAALRSMIPDSAPPLSPRVFPSRKERPHPSSHPPLLLASTSMADSRQPEDGAPQWDPSGGPEPAGTHGANGYSSSAYRTCQPGAAHMATSSYSARENGFNGELTGAHAVTAGKTHL